MRLQCEIVGVRFVWKRLGDIVVFEACDHGVPLADLVHTVPMETRVCGAHPPQDVLVLVMNGLLDSIALVESLGRDPLELPAVVTLEVP